MQHQEFYSKYKINYPPLENSLFSRKNWWRVALITIAAVLLEPLLMYKHQASAPFSFEYYFKLAGYFLAIVTPFVFFLLWVNWRESVKRGRGYGWMGKFEVTAMRSSFLFYYLLLAPGESNKIKVSRELFEKTRVGDFIVVRRDALGRVDEVSKINNISERLAKTGVKREP